MTFFAKPAMICAALAAFALPATTAFAEKSCPRVMGTDDLPKKYKRLAPLYNGVKSGWIFGANELDENYEIGDRHVALLEAIAAEFAGMGTRLAIIMPPPRVLATGQKTFDRTTGNAIEVDLKAVRKSFKEMNKQVRSLGILMPDLQALVQSKDKGAKAFYFQRDTHWTPYGAAQSARAMARVLSSTDVPAMPKNGEEAFAESGTYARVLKQACAKELAPELAPKMAFPAAQGGLLGEAVTPLKVALAGSSFSQRNGKDAYQMGAALSYFVGAPVANYSVSGGGAIGAIEGLVSSGALAENGFNLLIWELSFTEGLANEHALRQLLGAVQVARGGGALVEEMQAGQSLSFEAEATRPDVVVLRDLPAELERISLTVTFYDGKPKVVKMERKKHVPMDLRQGVWALSLLGLDGIKSIEVAGGM